MNAADVALVSAEAIRVALGHAGRARDDYNFSNSVNAGDVSIASAMAIQAASGTGSTRTTSVCP